MSKHTPGPWKLADLHKLGMYQNDGSVTVLPSDDYYMKSIASVTCHSDYKRGDGNKAKCDVRDANARLIAASPDLLEALRNAEQAIGHLNGEVACEETLHGIRKAIASATGET